MVLSWLTGGCSLFFADGPQVPEEHLLSYPVATHVVAHSCSGAKDIPTLKHGAVAALRQKLWSAVELDVVRHEKILKKVGVPGVMRRPSSGGSKQPMPAEHLLKADLQTHWRDKYEGSCILAVLERKKADFILVRDFEQAESQLTACFTEAEYADSASPSPEGYRRLRKAWKRYHLAGLWRKVILGHQDPSFEEREAKYISLLLTAAMVVRETPVLAVVSGAADGSWRGRLEDHVGNLLKRLEVSRPRSNDQPNGYILDVDLKISCDIESGAGCCARMPATIIRAGTGGIIAECDLSPDANCASSGGMEKVSLRTLFKGLEQTRALQIPLIECLGLVLPLD